MILIDSPLSNAGSISRALRAIDASFQTTTLPDVIAHARRLVLPGVGSFAAARRWLAETGIDTSIREAVANGAALLGICVGHQLLFDASQEMGSRAGLGLLRGEVQRFEGGLPVPQIGWNRVHATGPLFEGVEEEAFYFVNSYAARDVPDQIATAQYGGPFTAAVQCGRVFGVQFHPEKSSSAGLRVLRNFVSCT